MMNFRSLRSIVSVIAWCICIPINAMANDSPQSIPDILSKALEYEKAWRFCTEEVLRIENPVPDEGPMLASSFAFHFDEQYRRQELRPVLPKRNRNNSPQRLADETTILQWDGKSSLEIHPRRLVEKKSGEPPNPSVRF
jgi:hypothetical protein